MLSFVSWQDDLSAESDDDDVEVSQRRQAQFVTFIDFVLSFLSFKLYFIKGREFCLLSLKHNAQLRYFETRPSCQLCFITSCSLLSPAQILAETHPSVHGSPFLAHDPDTVGTFQVPFNPAGKVSTSLFLISFFEQFAAPMRRFTQVHCGQTSLNSHLISFMIE